MANIFAMPAALRHLVLRRCISTTTCRAGAPLVSGAPKPKSDVKYQQEPKKKPQKTSRTPLSSKSKPKPKSTHVPRRVPGSKLPPANKLVRKTPNKPLKSKTTTPPPKKLNLKSQPHLAGRHTKSKPPSSKPTPKAAPAAPKPKRTPKPAPKPAPTDPKPKRTPKPPPPAGPPPAPSISYLPPPSNDPSPRALPAAPPPPAALDAATAVFTARPPTFLFSAPRFLHLPPNTTTPEVCVLGRSNVGKSTLINAIGGLGAAQAGRAHGLEARRAQLAITSARAGSTVTMNGYAFGGVAGAVARAALAAREEERREALAAAGGSRGDRREVGGRLKERLPVGRVVLVDMPGYGLNSRSEWGVEIDKYFKRRKMLKGAVVLVDAKAGIKDGDRLALALLRNARVRTMVVMTKADKVGYGEEGMDKACLEVWKELRRVEGRGGTKWGEGNGWENEIWVTGAGDPVKGGGLGVEGARWAICKMVGLVKDKRKAVAMPPPVVVEEKKVEAQKIVPFDQINWGQSEKQVEEEKVEAQRIVPFDQINWGPSPKQLDEKPVEKKPAEEKTDGRITSMEALLQMAMEKKKKRRVKATF
ncbi:hypothetical protein QBC39DRAFT_335623 [Podospora conica]|nr:hypothetical protein QBC39DRAFT_335623 [Schizothecium conicum]